MTDERCSAQTVGIGGAPLGCALPDGHERHRDATGAEWAYADERRSNAALAAAQVAERQVFRLVQCLVPIIELVEARNAAEASYGGIESPHSPLLDAVRTARGWIADEAYAAVVSLPRP